MKKRLLELIMVLLMFFALYFTARHVIDISATAGTAGSTAKEGESASGPDYENRAMTGTVIIDCGHGGMDGGKVAVNNVLEKDINLSIGKLLKGKLEDNGYTVIMTRTDDRGLYSESDTNKKAADMKARCKIINESDADLVVSVHQNSYTSSRVRGAQMFYYKNSKGGLELAQCLTESFCETIGNDYTRACKYNDNYYMLLHTKCPTVIAECGFLSNHEEARLLASEEYQEKVAEALYLGIKKYYEMHK